MPILMATDMLLTGRWDYWMDIVESGSIAGSGPIPQLEWSNNHIAIGEVRKMLNQCLDGVYHMGATVNEFADWLLWSLAATKTPPNISAEVNEHFYRTFNLNMILRHPTDYMSGLLEEAATMGQKQALGYYSTPFNVTLALSLIHI